MFDWILVTIQEIIIPLGGWGIFIAAFLAQVIPPISTPLLIVISGALFLPDTFSFLFVNNLIFTIALPVALGVTIGSLPVYYLGYFAGKPLLEKWGKLINLPWEKVEKLEKKFEKSHWDEAILFGLRTFPILPTVAVSLSCGFVRFKTGSYLAFTFLGTFVKVLILSPLGWQAGLIYEKYVSVVGSVEKAGLATIIIIFLFFLIWKRYYKNKRNEKI